MLTLEELKTKFKEVEFELNADGERYPVLEQAIRDSECNTEDLFNLIGMPVEFLEYDRSNGSDYENKDECWILNIDGLIIRITGTYNSYEDCSMCPIDEIEEVRENVRLVEVREWVSV